MKKFDPIMLIYMFMTCATACIAGFVFYHITKNFGLTGHKPPREWTNVIERRSARLSYVDVYRTSDCDIEKFNFGKYNILGNDISVSVFRDSMMFGNTLLAPQVLNSLHKYASYHELRHALHNNLAIRCTEKKDKNYDVADEFFARVTEKLAEIADLPPVEPGDDVKFDIEYKLPEPMDINAIADSVLIYAALRLCNDWEVYYKHFGQNEFLYNHYNQPPAAKKSRLDYAAMCDSMRVFNINGVRTDIVDAASPHLRKEIMSLLTIYAPTGR